MSSVMQPPPHSPERRGEMAFDVRYMIFEYCEKMNAKNVSQVIAIMRKSSTGILADDGDTIEVKILALDNRTLWALWDFFEDNTAAREAAKANKAKRKREVREGMIRA